MNILASSLYFLFCCSLGYDGPFRTWYSANVSMPYTTRAINALYEESFDSNCIWLVGGNSCGDCVYCYNLTTNEMVNYDTLSVSNAYAYGKPGAVIINGIIYYMTQDGALYKYDISNKQLTFMLQFSGLTLPCLVKHPNNTLLYTLGANAAYVASNGFFIYDLTTDTNYTGNNLIYSRLSQSCVVHDYNTDYPFLYVFGGDTVYIEKIELNDNIVTNSWISVNNSFSSKTVVNANQTTWDWDSGKFRHGAIISFLNFIYIWNAWDGIDSNEAIGAMFSYDSETNTLKYITNYPVTECCSGFTYVTLNTRIYTFGGLDDYSTVTNNVYKSNKAILPTNPPSIMPTIMPSILPSHVPSMIPSTIPSYIPSNMPSAVPSNNPTVLPSSIPTDEPSVLPSIAPTEQPVDVTTTSVGSSATTQDSNAQGSNNGGSSNSSNDSISDNTVTIVLIVVIGGVLSICCIVVVCILKILLPYWDKNREYQQRIAQTQNNNNNNNNSNNNSDNNNNYNSNSNTNHTAVATNLPLMTNVASSTALLSNEIAVELAKLEHNKIESPKKIVSLNGDDIEGEGRNNNGGINGTANGGVSLIDMNDENESDDNIVNNNDNLETSGQFENDGNGNRKIAEIMVDGKKIEINYQDLMAIIKMKENDAKTNVKQKGENGLNQDDNQLL